MRKFMSAALFAAMASTALTPAMAQVPNGPDVLALGARVDNNSFDRAEITIGNQIQFWTPVFDTLLVQEPSGEIVPNMATDWSFSDDNLTLTLTLREGITFTDGTPFNAEAVKANIEYLAAGNGTQAGMGRGFSDIEVVSEYVVALHMEEPNPSVLLNLALVGGAMASPASLGADGSDVNPVGSGPYVLSADESMLGSHYTYRRNPDYWNPDAFPFDVITITPIDDNTARNNALFSGQVDGIIADARVVPQAESLGFTVNTGDVNYAGLVIADRAGTVVPALGDVRVRQALNMAFDEAAILQHIDGGYGRLTDSIFPDYGGAYLPELDDYYQYNPERARELLADAGYAEGLTLQFPDIPPFRAYAPIITQQLAEIGITAEFVGYPPGSVLPLLRRGDFPIYFFTFGGRDAWSDITLHLTPDAGWNAFGYSDPELNALIEAAQNASEGEEQTAAFQAVNRYTVENAFFAPWYRRYSIYLTNAETGVHMHPGNVAPPVRNYYQID